MKPKIGRLLRKFLLVLATLFVVILAAGCTMAIHRLVDNWINDWERWLFFGGGCMATTLMLVFLYQLWLRQWMQWLTQQFIFLHRFNHELTHAALALVTGAGLSSFNVSSYGGAVQVGRATQPSFVVAIAPYVINLPLLALVAVEFISPSGSPWFWSFMGAAFGYHVLGTIASMSPGQSDFQLFPYWVCIAWITALFILTSGLIAALVAGGEYEAWSLGFQTLRQSAHLLHTGLAALQHLRN